jgi:hypothetical protein
LFLVWPGGEAVEKTAPPRGQSGAVDCITNPTRKRGASADTGLYLRRTLARASGWSRSLDPQGKPAYSRSFPKLRNGADVALLMPSGYRMVTHLISVRASRRKTPRSQTSQAKFSKIVLRKEVIQPQVPLRLPCYDLVPITGFIFGACLAAPTTSDAPRFGGLTGGVYKAQEHIHRRSADRRLLAIPASCGRVAARNPNWGTIFAISAALRPGNALSVPL